MIFCSFSGESSADSDLTFKVSGFADLALKSLGSGDPVPPFHSPLIILTFLMLEMLCRVMYCTHGIVLLNPMFPKASDNDA